MCTQLPRPPQHHLLDDIVLAVERFAKCDPMFFVHARYLSEELAVWSWPREVLDELEARLDLDDPSLRHFILGRLWLEARRPRAAVAEFCDRAAEHFAAVEGRLRIGMWHESVREALGAADATPPAQARLTLPALASSGRRRSLAARS